jgi:hypothetical protein
LRRGAGNRRHRRREIGSTLDRRHHEFDGALAARAENPFETEPHRRRIAVERQFDRPAGQGRTLAGEQNLGRAVGMIETAARPARRIARLAPHKPPVRIAPTLFARFHHPEISHLQTPRKTPTAPARGIHAHDHTMR